MVPMGAYPTADGHLNVSALRDFRHFCELLDAPELADDPRYVDFASRHAHRAELDADLARRVAARARPPSGWRAWPSTCRADRCSRSTRCSPIRRCSTCSSRAASPHPTRGDIDVLRPPLTFSDTPATVRSGPPADGAHTRDVLSELGYSEDEIDDLHTSGAVGTQEHA